MNSVNTVADTTIKSSLRFYSYLSFIENAPSNTWHILSTGKKNKNNRFGTHMNDKSFTPDLRKEIKQNKNKTKQKAGENF